MEETIVSDNNIMYRYSNINNIKSKTTNFKFKI